MLSSPTTCIKRISAPQGTQRIARTPSRQGRFNSAMKMWSNTDVTQIIHKHACPNDRKIRRRVLRATLSSVECGQVVKNGSKKRQHGNTLSGGLVQVPSLGVEQSPRDVSCL